MSPRVVPKHERDALQMMGTLPVGSAAGELEHESVSHYVNAQARAKQGECTAAAPYQPGCSHSYFRDLLLVAESEARKDKAATHPILRGRDQGAPDFSDRDLEEAKERLRTAFWLGGREQRGREQRDIGSGSFDGLRPSLPGYLLETWGQAARSVGTLADAFGVR